MWSFLSFVVAFSFGGNQVWNLPGFSELKPTDFAAFIDNNFNLPRVIYLTFDLWDFVQRIIVVN